MNRPARRVPVSGLRADIIDAVEAEEPATESESVKIKDLIAALGG